MLQLNLAIRLVVLLSVLACARIAQSQTTDDELMLDELTWAESEWLDFTDDQEQPVERFKKGFFQQLQFKGGYLGSGDSDDLAIGYSEALVAVGVPLGSLENILGVAPKFRVDFLDGPSDLDLPSQLYTTGVNLLWRKQIHDRWGLMAIASPAVRSDFEATENTVRVFALGLASWQWIPDRLELSFGAVYLDRNDIPLLPALGLKARPTPSWLIDVMFPRPRVAYRFLKDGPRSELWGYFGGTIGGNTWAVLRDGVNDELTIRDYRLLLGAEVIADGGSGGFIEIGIALGRELEYQVLDQKYDFGDAFLVNAGVSY